MRSRRWVNDVLLVLLCVYAIESHLPCLVVFCRSLKRQKFMGGLRRDSTSAPKLLTAVQLVSVVSPRIAKTKSTRSLSVPFVPKVRSTFWWWRPERNLVPGVVLRSLKTMVVSRRLFVLRAQLLLTLVRRPALFPFFWTTFKSKLPKLNFKYNLLGWRRFATTEVSTYICCVFPSRRAIDPHLLVIWCILFG